MCACTIIVVIIAIRLIYPSMLSLCAFYVHVCFCVSGCIVCCLRAVIAIIMCPRALLVFEDISDHQPPKEDNVKQSAMLITQQQSLENHHHHHHRHRHRHRHRRRRRRRRRRLRRRRRRRRHHHHHHHHQSLC